MAALQVAERTGQGLDRTYRELLRCGKAPPTALDDGLQVRVIVPGGTGNDAFARFVADIGRLDDEEEHAVLGELGVSTLLIAGGVAGLVGVLLIVGAVVLFHLLGYNV